LQGAFEEAETSFKSEITGLKNDVERLKVIRLELGEFNRTNFLLQREKMDIHRRYRREQEIMLSAFHNRSMLDLRSHLGGQQPQARPESKSWLAQQRKMVSTLIIHDHPVD
jgi:hypothetical protein